MVPSLNLVQVMGFLGADPETRSTQSGMQVTNMRIATTEKWKDKQSGEAMEKTEWHSIVLWGRLAELANQYLGKGSPVYIQGKLQTRKWQDKEGHDRYSTEIVAQSMQFLGSKPDGQRGQKQQREAAPAGNREEFDDDIPF
ncbi:MAG: single-stranded DNA-binding protein [Terriglobia bacterium]|nr:single-stranded DNA-binding protein [Terriglobia bacterium]